MFNRSVAHIRDLGQRCLWESLPVHTHTYSQRHTCICILHYTQGRCLNSQNHDSNFSLSPFTKSKLGKQSEPEQDPCALLITIFYNFQLSSSLDKLWTQDLTWTVPVKFLLLLLCEPILTQLPGCISLFFPQTSFTVILLYHINNICYLTC